MDKYLPQHSSTFPVPVTKATPDWQPWQITSCKSPATTWTILSDHSISKTCHLKTFVLNSWFICQISSNTNYQLLWPKIGSSSIITINRRYFKKEFPKWLKWDNSIKCCHRTWLACGKKNRVQKDPPPWQAYPLWQNDLQKIHLSWAFRLLYQRCNLILLRLATFCNEYSGAN